QGFRLTAAWRWASVSSMRSILLAAVNVAALSVFPAAAETRSGLAAPAPVEVSAQSRQRQAAPRPRIRVTPPYRGRAGHSLYPRPTAVDRPGPHAVRQCAGGFVEEMRP